MMTPIKPLGERVKALLKTKGTHCNSLGTTSCGLTAVNVDTLIDNCINYVRTVCGLNEHGYILLLIGPSTYSLRPQMFVRMRDGHPEFSEHDFKLYKTRKAAVKRQLQLAKEFSLVAAVCKTKKDTTNEQKQI